MLCHFNNPTATAETIRPDGVTGWLAPAGDPAALAEALHVSERTLQRRLQEEGSSFQQLLDDTRRDLAVQHLAQPDLAPLEIAYLLGFADPSNFYRAFKRWYGVAPDAYRGRLAQE